MTKNAHGFTLIEVMVALVVAALALAGAATVISQMINTSTAMRDRTYASWIGQNKITELRLINSTPEVSETSGEVFMGGQPWQWTAVISETGVDNLFRVDVTVRHTTDSDFQWMSTGFIGEPGIPGLSNNVY